MKREFTTEIGSVYYVVESVNSPECHEVMREVLQYCNLEQCIRVCGLEATERAKAVNQLKEFCASFTDLPVFYFAGAEDELENQNRILVKTLWSIVAENAGFIRLEHLVMDDEFIPMVYALGESGLLIQDRINAYFVADALRCFGRKREDCSILREAVNKYVDDADTARAILYATDVVAESVRANYVVCADNNVKKLTSFD